MIDLSKQQREIIEAPLKPLAVTACAGSGKTSTAVRRLAAMRELLEDNHGHIALLSFSNLAVDTFNRDYNALLKEDSLGTPKGGIEISTVDAFITSNIIRPHGHLAMRCERTPFLVHGSEPFLKNFRVWIDKKPHPTTDIEIKITEEQSLQYEIGRANTVVDKTTGTGAIRKLAKVGAYSHSLGNLWALTVLEQQPLVRRALARRYPHILVDEAQDIGKLHELILTSLQNAGSQVSLIGDVNQGIYEFSGATGAFLANYADREEVESRKLDTNFRSVPSIVSIANALSGRDDSHHRKEPKAVSGAYYFAYKKTERDSALKSFAALLKDAEIPMNDAAVLCRSAKWADDWAGSEEKQGQGTLGIFVEAAIQRDKFQRYDEAFKLCCGGVISLLDDAHGDLLSDLVSHGGQDKNSQMLRRMLWAFVKDATGGSPYTAV